VAAVLLAGLRTACMLPPAAIAGLHAIMECLTPLAGLIPVLAHFEHRDDLGHVLLEAVPMSYTAILCECSTAPCGVGGGEGAWVWRHGNHAASTHAAAVLRCAAAYPQFYVEYSDILRVTDLLSDAEQGYINFTQPVVNRMHPSREGYRSVIYAGVQVSQTPAGVCAQRANCYCLPDLWT